VAARDSTIFASCLISGATCWKIACGGGRALVSLLPALEGYVVPSKLYGILAAGRPLIFIGDGKGDVGRSSNRAVRRTVTVAIARDCGPHSANSPDPDGLLRLGARARRIFEQEYSLQRALSRWRP